jgi:hypothetical protein
MELLTILTMEVTLIKHTDKKHSIQYGLQQLAKSHGIEEYRYANISEAQLEEIKKATTDQVEVLLSKWY